MFGESDSESPRVPSPWDTFISTPPSPAPSPLARTVAIPRLVPEQDDGNVEYKLQLLSPSPARFARLVTQMKWRLLEGGGQAYYELGVADSGMLVGLPRAELEQSLETLEMMAGEIGASVIVVKEIEVPAAMLDLVASQTTTSGSWNGKRPPGRRRQGLLASSPGSTSASADDSTATSTATETELSATDVEDDVSPSTSPKHDSGVFSMDDVESDIDLDADVPAPVQAHFDLEIASVYKPRPVRTKSRSAPVPLPSKKGKARGPKSKKGAHLPDVLSLPPDPSLLASGDGTGVEAKATKAQNRRAARDRRREERRRALLQSAAAAVVVNDGLSPGDQEADKGGTGSDTDKACANVDADAELIPGLEALHVSVAPEPVVAPVSQSPVESAATVPVLLPAIELNGEPAADDVGTVFIVPEDGVDLGEDDDDVFPSPHTAVPGPFTGLASHLTVPVEAKAKANGSTVSEGNTEGPQPRLIVEALVVRKMSLEEAFLDFSGFSLT